MAGYTKGPWIKEGACGVVAGKRTVATAWPNPKCDDGSMGENARLIAVSTIIPDLYASEINARIEWFWDGGFDVAIGDDLNGWRETASIDDWVDALRWLEYAACRHFPDSDFALAKASPKDREQADG